jgi:hypothetical protein
MSDGPLGRHNLPLPTEGALPQPARGPGEVAGVLVLHHASRGRSWMDIVQKAGRGRTGRRPAFLLVNGRLLSRPAAGAQRKTRTLRRTRRQESTPGKPLIDCYLDGGRSQRVHWRWTWTTLVLPAPVAQVQRVRQGRFLYLETVGLHRPGGQIAVDLFQVKQAIAHRLPALLPTRAFAAQENLLGGGPRLVAPAGGGKERVVDV